MDRSIALLRHLGFDPRSLQSAGTRLQPPLRALLLVSIAYYFGARAGFSIGTLSDSIFAPFWPPNAILFCALLFVPTSHWWLYIAAALPAHVLAETAVAMPLRESLVAFGANGAVATLSAFGVRRFLKDAGWFGTLRQSALYTLIAVLICPAIAAFGGAFVRIVGGQSITDYWTYWGGWFIANALGNVTLGPVFLIWSTSRSEDEPQLTLARKLEGVLLVLCLVVVCAIAFHVDQKAVGSGFLPAILYSPLPLILWAAIRFGERGSSAAILVVTVVAIWQNLHASTIFIGLAPGTSVLALQIFLLGIAVPVLFLGSAIDELRRSGEATRRLAGALLQAQDEERRRIARELHDSTGQQLAMANLMAGKIQMLAPPSGDRLIAELKEILQRVAAEIRTVSYLLHPPLLDIGGLSLALRSYLEGFSSRTGIAVDLELSPDLGRLPSYVELVLFRVVQEALTNVWRHSGSARARIQLVRQLSGGLTTITLRIEDSGKGIPSGVHRPTMAMGKDRSRAPFGVGLMGMRERMRQIGGRLEIDSSIGKTIIQATVTLSIELNREDSA